MGYAPQIDIYQGRWSYVVDGLEHKFQSYFLPVDFSKAPGDVPSAYGVYTHAALQVSFQQVADALWGAVDDFFSVADTQFGVCELWRASADSQDYTYLSSFTTAIPPINVLAYEPASEVIHTFRTVGGTIMRMHVEETPQTVSVGIVPNVVVPVTAHDFFMQHVLAAPSVYVDRHGNSPIAPLRYFRGSNEAIFKRRFRQ